MTVTEQWPIAWVDEILEKQASSFEFSPIETSQYTETDTLRDLVISDIDFISSEQTKLFLENKEISSPHKWDNS